MIYKSINKRAIDDGKMIASLKYEIVQLQSKLDYICMMTGINIDMVETNDSETDNTITNLQNSPD